MCNLPKSGAYSVVVTNVLGAVTRLRPCSM